MCKLSKRESEILEVALRHVSYKEAAQAIGMNEKVYYTYMTRIRRKVELARKFLSRMRRYDKVLYKHYKYEEAKEE